jgi:hypothetical protein
VGLLLWGWCAPLAGQSLAEESGSSRMEYEVKAAFVHNFTKFVEWSRDSFESEDSPIRMGILGQGPITEPLMNLDGKEVKNRSLSVSAINSLDNANEFHIIFFNPSERENITSLLSSLNNSSVLTIGDMPGFAEECGIINFYLKGGKVRFEVNVAVSRRERLKISSKLLRLARIVDSECD